MFIDKRMIKITKNIRGEESYVHYIKRVIKNSGSSKGRNIYGDGDFVVFVQPNKKNITNQSYMNFRGCYRIGSNIARPIPSEGKGNQQNYRFKHTVASISSLSGGSTSLEQQQLTFDNFGRCTNAYKFLSHTDLLLGSYGKIKSKPCNMTKGTDNETLDGMSINYIENLHRNLKNESWSPKPTRRIYLEKLNGKRRPLSISSPRDKIVQESMRTVLELVLEPKFLDCSHGFRLGKSCHSALGKIRYWNGIKWFLEGDITSFFDEIDHHILESLLKKHFNDQQFLDLYWKMVRAGYVEYNTLNKSYSGTPQGSIISPILSNLYLNELDTFIEAERLKLKGLYKKTYKANKEYNTLDNRIQNITKKERILNARGEKLKKEEKLERAIKVKIRRKTRSTIPDETTAKIYYVRYVDDWIIGAIGTFNYVKNLKNRIKTFLYDELKLSLSDEKTLITNTFGIKPATFLGTNITRVKAMKNQIKNYKNRKGHKVRISSTATRMTAPIHAIIEKMIAKKIAEKKINRHGMEVIQGKARSGWQNLPIKDIIIRFKAILNGILNYYSFVDNKSRLNIVYWILKSGLAKTIAAKKKLKSMKKVFTKYGNNLELSEIPFKCPSLENTPKNFGSNLHKNDYASYLEYFKWGVRTRATFLEGCRICSSHMDVEMHHLKHIRTLNIKLKGIDKEMASINRKQIPVCKQCHLKIHAGEY